MSCEFCYFYNLKLIMAKKLHFNLSGKTCQFGEFNRILHEDKLLHCCHAKKVWTSPALWVKADLNIPRGIVEYNVSCEFCSFYNLKLITAKKLH